MSTCTAGMASMTSLATEETDTQPVKGEVISDEPAKRDIPYQDGQNEQSAPVAFFPADIDVIAGRVEDQVVLLQHSFCALHNRSECGHTNIQLIAQVKERQSLRGTQETDRDVGRPLLVGLGNVLGSLVQKIGCPLPVDAVSAAGRFDQ